jgi:hypothetical protein
MSHCNVATHFNTRVDNGAPRPFASSVTCPLVRSRIDHPFLARVQKSREIKERRTSEISSSNTIFESRVQRFFSVLDQLSLLDPAR